MACKRNSSGVTNLERRIITHMARYSVPPADLGFKDTPRRSREVTRPRSSRGNGRVAVGQGVAAQFIDAVCAFVQNSHNSVNTKFAVTLVKDKLSTPWAFRAKCSHGKAVAGINRGQHTAAASDEPHFRESARFPSRTNRVYFGSVF
jgi:hypothetical protein